MNYSEKASDNDTPDDRCYFRAPPRVGKIIGAGGGHVPALRSPSSAVFVSRIEKHLVSNKNVTSYFILCAVYC